MPRAFVVAGAAGIWMIAGVFRLSASATPQQSPASPPRDVRYCEVATNPQSFDRVRVRITAFVKWRFEEFVLLDPECPTPTNPSFEMWVTYGGDVPSGAIYAVGNEGFRGPTPKPKKDAEFPLVADRTYTRFRGFLKTEDDVIVRATLVGTVLVKPPAPPDQFGGGYGHFGCCSLFVIERIEQFDDRRSQNLDRSASAGGYDLEDCHIVMGSSRIDRELEPSDAVRQQREADAGLRRWAFDAPERVALEAMRAEYGPDVTDLIRVGVAPGRQVFEWPRDGSWSAVAVIRPAWLSWFAKSADVVWVASFVGTSTCDIDIHPDGDIRAQVLAALTRGFGGPVIHPALTDDVLARAGVVPAHRLRQATFFEQDRSYAVAVEFDDQGWPAGVDIRPKSRYPVSAKVWRPDSRGTNLDMDVPMDGRTFRSVVHLLDAVRAFGAPVGALAVSGAVRTQRYEHATLVWEDGSRDKAGSQHAVRAFRVQWLLSR